MSRHYLTVSDLSVRLGVCKMTVYRLIHAGHIPAVKVGKQYRIDPVAFNDYLGRVSQQHDSRDGTGQPAA